MSVELLSIDLAKNIFQLYGRTSPASTGCTRQCPDPFPAHSRSAK
jgi:hypothetical protein